MITNDELEILLEVEKYLWNNNSTDLYLKLHSINERVMILKEKASKNANNYNKEHKEYHRLMANLSNAKKRGNEELIKKYTKAIDDYRKKK